VRGVVNPEASNAMQTDAYFEAQQTVDILDDNGGIAQSFDSMISQADVKRRQEIMDRINRQATAPTVDIIPVLPPASAPVAPVVAPPAPVADPYASLQPVAAPVVTQTAPDPQVSFNPYPTSMHQSVVRPLSEQSVATQAPPVAVPPAPNTSEKPVSPDIINLANNADLSIETIAHEAKRIQQKEEQLKDDGEVVISLR
jgi:hypothetical protein